MQLVNKLRALRGSYKAVFGSPVGQEVLRDLARRFNFMTSTVGDAHEMAVMEGQRTVILHILTMLRMSDEDILRMAGQTTVMDEENNG